MKLGFLKKIQKKLFFFFKKLAFELLKLLISYSVLLLLNHSLNKEMLDIAISLSEYLF